MTEPERLTPTALRTLFLFEDLTEDQLSFFAERGRAVQYEPGAVIHAEGQAASCFLVLLSGTLAISSRVDGGEIELFRTDHRGAYTGAFRAFVIDRDVPQLYSNTCRAVTEARLFELPASDFGRAVRDWFPMAAHLLEGASTQGRAAADTLARHEKLVALGSVTASLTHELNNPVAAAVRATARLREQLDGMKAQVGRVIMSELTIDQLQVIADLAGEAMERRRSAPKLSPLDSSDREAELEDWLEDHGVPEASDAASVLVAAGLDVEWAERFTEALPPDAVATGLAYPVRAVESDSLLDEISDAAERISALLEAARQYTQMDRAPLQSCDIHEGLDATITMLGYKLGDGVEVVRDYAPDLPTISAYPAELNQVWTNLLDNAVAAMDGRGTLTISTLRLDDDHLRVEIGDTGPGIPDEVRDRVFEPFFTTKPLGEGTGLGLDIAWRIVVGRHHGDIRVAGSEPGGTCFHVVLPVRDVEAERG